MWIPGDAAEIERAARAGELVETPTFDAKADLPAPTKNASLAVDVAAMSTDGGVLLYGIGEDEHGQPTVPLPIGLAGAGDRIGQIVATSISEVPYIDVRAYPLPHDQARGYLLVVVPQSARAPHQVTVGHDYRYYGRGATGNRRLSEGDVARLYERRQSWAVDREELLVECIASAPLRPHPAFGYVHAFARPVAPGKSLWDRAVEAHGPEQNLRRELAAAAAASSVTGTFDPSFASGSLSWHRQGADWWRVSKWPQSYYSDPERLKDPSRLLEAAFSVDGRGRLFCGSATRVWRNNNPRIMEVIIAGTMSGFLSMLGALYRDAGYHGAVDVGVAVTNLHGAGSLAMQGDFSERFYGATEFTNTARWSAAELHDAEQRTRDLLSRFFEASTGRPGYDPFADR